MGDGGDEASTTIDVSLPYHMLGQVVPSVVLETRTSVTSLEGSPITVASPRGGITLNGHANVLRKNVLANNGIVYILDQVLTVPPPQPSVDASSSSDAASSGEDSIDRGISGATRIPVLPGTSSIIMGGAAIFLTMMMIL